MTLRLTVRHLYDFGADRQLVGDDLVRVEAWDALRLRSSGPFALAADRTEWEERAKASPALEQRAQFIAGWLREAGALRVASYGVGTGALELLLHRAAPDVTLTVTDYGPETVRRLSVLFPEADVRRHDLRHDPPLDANVHILHRVDSELSDPDWREMLARFESHRLLVLATEVASVQRVMLELLFRVRRRQASRAGWLRTRGAFESLWHPTHDARHLKVADLWGWDLRPRKLAFQARPDRTANSPL
jgi:hypothetical protein